MNLFPDLRTSLLDLLCELDGSDIRLIIGGGFGIFLKIEHVQQLGIRTLLEECPEPRSTNDLDLFLRAEVLIESAKARALAEAMSSPAMLTVSEPYTPCGMRTVRSG